MSLFLITYLHGGLRRKFDFYLNLCYINYSFYSFSTSIITQIYLQIKFSSQSPLTHVHTWSAAGRYIPWVWLTIRHDNSGLAQSNYYIGIKKSSTKSVKPFILFV
jgi:hypothetical protein